MQAINPFFERIGVGMMVVILAGSAGPSYADDTTKDPARSASPREGFFAIAEVDFWGTKHAVRRAAPGRSASLDRTSSDQDLWQDVVLEASGRVTSYRPPAVVVQLLENPTEENARKYLQWQRARLDRIRRAQEMIERVEGLEGADGLQPSHAADDTQPSKPASSGPDFVNWRDVELVYFYAPACPYCAIQDEHLERFAKAHPQAKIVRVDASRQQDLALALQVRATPTILVRRKGSKTFARMEGVREVLELERGVRDHFAEARR